MAFGPIIDVPILSFVFGVFIKYKNYFIHSLIKIKLPRILLALLIAVPLLTLEEHINCGAYGCANVVFPPTIWFLLAEMLVFFLMFKYFHINKLIPQLAIYGIFGILFEFFIGAARKGLHELAITNPMVFILLTIWVGFSYVFVIYLPLLIINLRPDSALTKAEKQFEIK